MFRWLPLSRSVTVNPPFSLRQCVHRAGRRSAANPPHVAASVAWCDRQTDRQTKKVVRPQSGPAPGLDCRTVDRRSHAKKQIYTSVTLTSNSWETRAPTIFDGRAGIPAIFPRSLIRVAASAGVKAVTSHLLVPVASIPRTADRRCRVKKRSVLDHCIGSGAKSDIYDCVEQSADGIVWRLGASAVAAWTQQHAVQRTRKTPTRVRCTTTRQSQISDSAPGPVLPAGGPVSVLIAVLNPAATCWVTLSIRRFRIAYSWPECANRRHQ